MTSAKQTGWLAVAAPLALALSLAASCKGDRDASEDDSAFDASPRRHVFAPPPGEVRAVPPHAIRSAGVGPYLLGASLEEILGLLPHGPRVELLQIQGLLDYSLVRIEDDAIAIGVERFEGVTFVAVLDPEIARTEDGVGVGTRERDLREALGPVSEDPSRVRDPRMLDFAALPNTQFVVEGGEVVAVIVRHGAGGAAAGGEPALACDDGERWSEAGADAIAEAVGASLRRRPIHTAVGCFGSAARAGLLVTQGNRLVVLGGEPDAPRRRGASVIEDLVYAAPLDVTGDGRHEIAAVAARRRADELDIELLLLEPADGRMPIVDRYAAYSLSSRWATWVGAKLDDTELLVEASAGGGALHVGGLYVHRDQRGTRIVAPLRGTSWAPSIAREPAAAEPSGEDAGPPDAGDAGSPGGEAAAPPDDAGS